MLRAYWYRYQRTLRRNAPDTVSMFIRPLVTTVLFAIFATTITGSNTSASFLVASVAIFNLVTNTVIGAAYESSQDVRGERLGLVAMSPGGLSRYLMSQTAVQLVITLSQSLLIILVFLSSFDFASLSLRWFFDLLVLVLFTYIIAVIASKQTVFSGNFSRISFVITLVLVFGGAYYPINDLPPWAQVISDYNPFTYLIDSVRSPLVGSLPVNSNYDTELIVGTGLALTCWLVISLLQRIDTSKIKSAL